MNKIIIAVGIVVMVLFLLILGVIDSSPARNFNDLVQWSKANANSSNYSYPAASFQLVMELIKSRSGLMALSCS